MALFQTSVLNKYLKEQEGERVAAAYAKFTAHFHDAAIQANIREAKEEQYQEGFLRDLFVNVLGYTLNPQKDFELTSEFKNEKGAKKADGAILQKGKALAVIELKGTDTTDLQTINTQAFNYKANHTDCVYVITSNFHKLRFFIDNAVEHLEFDLFTLREEEFRLLWLCLQRDNLLGGIPKKVKAESLQQEEKITKLLYKDYSTFKNALWQDLCTNHMEHDKLLLYKKSQKLLDRFLFVLFSEDKGLLPPNTLRGILDQWHKLTELDEYRPLYERCQKYFGWLNTGYKSGTQDIFAYNGGLFKPDELLDSVRISDAVLETHLTALHKYDFGSEVDVNILGHIFEHSLNEIENITAQLEGRAVDSKKTKRKKDGVFYTPKYITQYIVEHTVGRLCTEKKDELGVLDEEYAKGRKGRQKKTIQELDTKLDVYRDWLLALTICDPACGSGAFLNQALDFLITEHRYVDELQASLLGHSITFKDIGDHILERNIYGVDINEESVEIARLSLWLRTATKGRKLNDLSSNIKCGNSLIDDPAVAGAKAFDWKREFPRVFEKGGFDVVVGNPPYVDVKALEPVMVDHLFKSFKSANNRINLYSIFIEHSITLLQPVGSFSFIIPSSLLTQDSYSTLRGIILDSTRVQSIVRLPNESFGGGAGEVKVDTVILTFQKGGGESMADVYVYKGFDRITEITRFNTDVFFEANTAEWKADPEHLFRINVDSTDVSLLSKIEANTVSLVDCAEFCLGLTPYDKYRGHTPEQIEGRVFHATTQKDDTFRPLLAGNDITRYNVKWNGEEWISYGKWLGAAREQKFFTEKRILVKQIIDWSAKRIWSALTSEELYNTQNAFNLVPKEGFSAEYLIAVLNSSLMSFYHRKKFLEEFKDRFQKILIKDCKLFPVKVVDLKDQDVFVALVTQIVDQSKEHNSVVLKFADLLRFKYTLSKLSRNLENWPTLAFKEFLKELKKVKVVLTLAEEAEWLGYFTEQQAKAHALQAEIDKTDKEIDALVYQLYGLTEEEVKVVEGIGLNTLET